MQTTTVAPEPTPTSKKLSKAERRAKQAEFNRQLWADALVKFYKAALGSKTSTEMLHGTPTMLIPGMRCPLKQSSSLL